MSGCLWRGRQVVACVTLASRIDCSLRHNGARALRGCPWSGWRCINGEQRDGFCGLLGWQFAAQSVIVGFSRIAGILSAEHIRKRISVLRIMVIRADGFLRGIFFARTYARACLRVGAGALAAVGSGECAVHFCDGRGHCGVHAIGDWLGRAWRRCWWCFAVCRNRRWLLCGGGQCACGAVD